MEKLINVLGYILLFYGGVVGLFILGLGLYYFIDTIIEKIKRNNGYTKL